MHTKWTDEEVTIIEEMACLYTVKQIAYRLKIRGYARSTSAIHNKLRFLGYSARLISYQLSVISFKPRTLLITVHCQNPPQRIKNRIAAIDKDAIEYLVGKLA